MKNKFCLYVGLSLSASFGIAIKCYALTLEQQTWIYDSYAFEKNNDLTHAIEKMVQVLQKNPQDYFTNLRLGWLFYSQRKFRNSIDHYERARKINPKSIEPLLGLTTVYMGFGDYDKVSKTCRFIFEQDPKNYTGLQKIILAEIQLKHYPQAQEYIERALQLYPTAVAFLENKAFVLKELGKKEESSRVLDALLLVSPNNAYGLSQITSK